jgi:hypothetical protein
VVVGNGFQEIKTNEKNGIPSRDTRTSQLYVCNVRWKRKLGLLSLIAAVKKMYISKKISVKISKQLLKAQQMMQEIS